MPINPYDSFRNEHGFTEFKSNLHSDLRCSRCLTTKLVPCSSNHFALLHWKLNPGLAINELLLGQRIPKTLYVCKRCSHFCFPTFQTVLCEHCNRQHSVQIWNHCGFGNWMGLVCPDCGGEIPSLTNFTSRVLMTLLSPVAIPIKRKLHSTYTNWARKRIARSRDKYYTGR